MAFTLTLVSDPTSHERVEGTFSVTDGGVLTVQEQGRAPRIYSPSAWISVEDSMPQSSLLDEIRDAWRHSRNGE
jgi:hypothetical protein